VEEIEIEVAVEREGEPCKRECLRLLNSDAFGGDWHAFDGDLRVIPEQVAHALIGALFGGRYRWLPSTEVESRIRAAACKLRFAVAAIRPDGSRGDPVCCSWPGEKILDMPHLALGGIVLLMALDSTRQAVGG
jgi:hypothetical protein